MSPHIPKERILKYVMNLLSASDKREVEQHLISCNICIMKVTHAYAKRKDACAKSRDLLKSYAIDRIGREDTEFMKNHLLICDPCFEQYQAVVRSMERSKSTDIERGGRRASMQLPERSLKFDNLKKHIIASREKPGIELKKRGMTIKLSSDARGNLKVALVSDKYAVSGVTVALGKKSRTGFVPVAENRTTSRGSATFGQKDEDQVAKVTTGASLQISGLRKKT